MLPSVIRVTLHKAVREVFVLTCLIGALCIPTPASDYLAAWQEALVHNNIVELDGIQLASDCFRHLTRRGCDRDALVSVKGGEGMQSLSRELGRLREGRHAGIFKLFGRLFPL